MSRVYKRCQKHLRTVENPGEMGGARGLSTSLLISDKPSRIVLWLEVAGIFLFSSEGFSSSLRYVCRDLSVATAMKFLRFPDAGGVGLHTFYVL